MLARRPFQNDPLNVLKAIVGQADYAFPVVFPWCGAPQGDLGLHPTPGEPEK